MITYLRCTTYLWTCSKVLFISFQSCKTNKILSPFKIALPRNTYWPSKPKTCIQNFTAWNSSSKRFQISQNLAHAVQISGNQTANWIHILVPTIAYFQVWFLISLENPVTVVGTVGNQIENWIQIPVLIGGWFFGFSINPAPVVGTKHGTVGNQTENWIQIPVLIGGWFFRFSINPAPVVGTSMYQTTKNQTENLIQIPVPPGYWFQVQFIFSESSTVNSL